MIVLGIDTATPQVGCAIGGPGGPLASFHATRGRRHAETLAPAISLVCEQSGVTLGQIGAVAVDTGPGLFTGLRVGLATAKALAHAAGIPVVPMTSLDLLAHPYGHAGRLVGAVVDARRGEVFWALYRPVAGGIERLTDYAVDAPAVVAKELAARGEPLLLVGDGARRYAGILEDSDAVEVAGDGSPYPSAAVLVEQAQPLAAAGQTVPAADLAPRYLRAADTRINWEQRQSGPLQAASDAAASGRPARAHRGGPARLAGQKGQ